MTRQVYVVVAEQTDTESDSRIVGVADSLDRAQRLAETDIALSRGHSNGSLWSTGNDADPADQTGRVVALAKWWLTDVNGCAHGFPNYHSIERWEVSS